MKAKAFQIHWHNKQPIYSVDFHPTNSNKLATCGGDNNVRVRIERGFECNFDELFCF